MTDIIELNPRVQWARSGFVGHVSLHWEQMGLDERNRLTQAVVARVADEWTSYDEVRGKILVAKPRSAHLGGGALREEVDHRVRAVRDVAKAVLREAGFKGVR